MTFSICLSGNHAQLHYRRLLLSFFYFQNTTLLSACQSIALIFMLNSYFLSIYSFTLPTATPCTICLERIRYTMITGKMENAIAIYTCPISNFSQSAARSCAIRIGSVFLLSSCRISAGVK